VRKNIDGIGEVSSLVEEVHFGYLYMALGIGHLVLISIVSHRSSYTLGTCELMLFNLEYLADGSFLFAVLDFLIGGAIGFIASYFAVRRLYSSIRVD
jgi:hypothetical protein